MELLTVLVLLQALLAAAAGVRDDDRRLNDSNSIARDTCVGLCHGLSETMASSCLTKCNLEAIPEGSSRFELVSDGQLGPLELLCRQENMLVVQWRPVSWATGEEDGFIYVASIGEKQSQEWITEKQVTSYQVTFDNLTQNTEYRVRVRVFDTLGLYIETEDVFTTLSEDFQPLEVPDVWVDDVTYSNETEEYDVTVQWTPSTDKTCFYDLLWWPQDGSSHLEHREIREPSELFYATFSGLNFGVNHSLSITAKSDSEIDGPKVYFSFRTPTCVEQHASLETCVPPAPDNVTAYETTSVANATVYDVIVAWSKPLLEPESYLVTLTPLTKGRMPVTANVSGSYCGHTFTGVDLGPLYVVTVVAISSTGRSPPGELLRHKSVQTMTKESDFQFGYWGVIGTLLVSLLAIGALGSAIVYGCHRRRKKLRNNERCRYFEDLEERAPHTPHTSDGSMSGSSPEPFDSDDPLEVPSERLQLLEQVLGSGAFGVVRRGWLLDMNGTKKREVAVKLLKENPTDKDVSQFLQEMEMMRTVGSHPHVVSLLACCSKHGKRPMLVTEYCALGDLQNYLRNEWLKILSYNSKPIKSTNNNFYPTTSRPSYADISSKHYYRVDAVNNIIVNNLYELQGAELEQSHIITPGTLLSFARQISLGMEFLSDHHIVHRDLAARNVLVCADLTVKIADFGLSRDVYCDNEYRTTSGGKVPVKWMALECLLRQVYTTQSDVWSFGILLWEIVTLGGMPYPSTPTNRMVKLLSSGHRMERPPNCSEELFLVMSSCWLENPLHRPSFANITAALDKLLDSTSASTYLNLQAAGTGPPSVRHSQINITSTDPYMNPIMKSLDCKTQRMMYSSDESIHTNSPTKV